MTGRGRPTTGVKIQVRIPADLLASIDQLANHHDTTRAAMIRQLLASTWADRWHDAGIPGCIREQDGTSCACNEGNES